MQTKAKQVQIQIQTNTKHSSLFMWADQHPHLTPSSCFLIMAVNHTGRQRTRMKWNKCNKRRIGKGNGIFLVDYHAGRWDHWILRYSYMCIVEFATLTWICQNVTTISIGGIKVQLELHQMMNKHCSLASE